MKRWITLYCAAAALGLLAACAGTGGANSDGAAAGGGSGITVFGTIDTGVSGYRTESQKR